MIFIHLAFRLILIDFMKRRIYLALFLGFLTCSGALAQPLNKVVASKHGNGKPETIYFYKGETNPENLIKQERYAVDGKKVLEKTYVNGKLHGPTLEWKEFDGAKTAELNYEGGLLSGKQVYYFSDGKPKLELNYTAGKLEGRQIEYWFKKSADSLQSEHNYSGGILHGMQRRWTKEGASVYNLNFVAGKPEGLQRVWSAEGVMTEQRWKQGVMEEPLKNWTAAQPKHVRVYDYKAQGDSLNVVIGKVLQKEVWYYETGAIEALTSSGDAPETQVFYLGGKLMGKGKGTLDMKEGKWEYWHPNGKKMMGGEYKAGKQVGLFESWDENGKLVSEEFWNPNGSGRETWKVFSYHPAGAKESEGTLDASGHKKGKWKYWFASGNKMREEDWDYACTNGKGRPFVVNVTSWDDSGRMISKGNEADQQVFTYYANGNVQEVNTLLFKGRDVCGAGPAEVYKEGKFMLEVPAAPDYNKSLVIAKVSFFENGDTMRVDQFGEDGKRDGYQKGWYPDGKPQYSYHYQKGGVQGSVKEWYPTGQLMLDHRYSTVGGTPTLQEGTYYTDKAKDYPYTAADGKKKKVMEEIDAISHFSKFWQENK
jgi:antitoxin component YwqK of YwqJK toxin-antitoxin module